ncbi:MAG: RtcB family protein [Dehalococcoidales bacterium]|jgi:tRNA-splicing ligase RtcB|nr:RtcB family protein [Dehalococcoidales bacterium]MDP7285610.1 RtcB family protein [Dehalococcoidales bacterium]MDP7416202.1 RtcB family protein [Dehalococcoidales bacterium]
MPQWNGLLEKIDDYRWRIPKNYKAGMRVPGIIYADEALVQQIQREQSPEQVANMALLPGIVNYSLAMPDIHWGYGFPIGGVAAMKTDDGVVSPGGIGFDINCGVRILRTNLTREEVLPKIKELMDSLYNSVPSGVGSKGRIKLKPGEVNQVLVKGSRWSVEKGYGRPDDLDTTEENGEMAGADPSQVSGRAKERGTLQLGTLGSGNHFLEVAIVDKIYETDTAGVMGIDRVGQVMLLIHCGSRGLGHQVADDYIKEMVRAMVKYDIQLPDRQLACSPVKSPEGQAYLGAMRCAANYAWANRQCITHWVRQSFCQVMDQDEKATGLELIYDVTHNIAKIEEHEVGGQRQKLCVHRKGATRAFPVGHPDIPPKYSRIGQPVLIPGDMGRFSYVLVGTEQAMKETFGSTCHGAGRVQSRAAAKKQLQGRDVLEAMETRGITVRAGSLAGLAEEASQAYKDVSMVVEITRRAGISKPVARTSPIGVIKG